MLATYSYAQGEYVTGIENHISFSASPRAVYKQLANPQNIPLYAPGILNASTVEATEEGVGTRVSLLTRHGRPLEALITGESERRFISIQDSHGVVNEWELKRSPDGGTLAVNRILGVADPDRAEALSHDAREKLFAFRDFVESRNGHR